MVYVAFLHFFVLKRAIMERKQSVNAHYLTETACKFA